MRKVYMLTNVLKPEFGGRSRGIFRRAGIGLELGYDVEVLFCGFQWQLEDQIELLKNEGEINREIKVTQWFNDLRREDLYDDVRMNMAYESPINFDEYEVLAHPTKPKLRVLKKDGVLMCKVEIHPITNKVVKIDVNAGGTHTIRERKYYDVKGNLYRQLIYFPRVKKEKHQVMKDIIYNIDGSPLIEVNYELIDGFSTRKAVVYKNGKYPDITCKNWGELRAYWLKHKIENNSVITLSARKLDSIIDKNDFKQRNINKIYWLHNDHNSPLYEHFLKGDNDCRIIALTPEQRDEIISETNYKFEQFKVFNQAFRQAQINDNYDPKKLVIVSRFHNSQKNLLAAISGFAKFLETNPGYSLDLWGFGGSEQEIRDYIDQHQLANSVFIKGKTNNPAEKFANSAAFLITSHFEGLGKTIIESIACGCPVAAYDFKYGPRSFIKVGKSGYIDEAKNDENFARVIEQTLALNEKYTRSQIASNVATFEQVLEEEKEFFADITADKKHKKRLFRRKR